MTETINDRAWEIYCEDTAGSMDVRDYWEQLPLEVQTIYIAKAVSTFKTATSSHSRTEHFDEPMKNLNKERQNEINASMAQALENAKTVSQTRTEDFDESLKTLTQERGLDYGSPSESFGIAYQIAQAVDDCPHPGIKHAMRMIGVKMSRLVFTPDHPDSIKDIMGYARTMAMILDEEDKKNV